jgi:phosphoenolpyruvate-protein kinase (PTS system EI component)
MIRLVGVGASRGIAIGPAHVLAIRAVIVERRILRSDREAERARLDGAVALADGQLLRLEQQMADAHPAILRTLKSLAEVARTADIPISICGDMAGDPFLTLVLIGLGYRELSMDPDRIPLVKGVVRGSSLVEAEKLAAQVLELESEVETIALVRTKIGDRFESEMEGFLPRAMS